MPDQPSTIPLLIGPVAGRPRNPGQLRGARSVWTPLIPATMNEEKVAEFGEQVPYGRAAAPDEIAPSYVFFASSQLSSYDSGEVLAPIGGETLPG